MAEQTASRKSDNRSAIGATIAATATAVPPYVVTHEEVKAYLNHVFPLEASRLEAMMAIVGNSLCS